MTISGTKIASNGSFSDGDALGVSWYRTGDKGQKGQTGSDGDDGTDGSKGQKGQTGASGGGGGASGASTALDNLASVAVNTSIISDTNNTDDLGSSSKRWARIYSAAYFHDTDEGQDISTIHSGGGILNDLAIESAGGLLMAAASMPSDSAIKENIQATNTFDISLLAPKNYQYTAEFRNAATMYPLDDRIHYGYVAQDLQAINAEYVTDTPDPRNTDNTILKITDKFYAEMHASLIKEIVDLKARVAALEG